MAEKQAFALAQILSITTGRLLCEDIGAVYDILNYMTGDNLFTHQLPRASDEARPAILAQHPELADLELLRDAAGVTPDNWREFLARQQRRFGSELFLEPLSQGEHIYVNPVDELVALAGDPKKVIVVDMDEAQEAPDAQT